MNNGTVKFFNTEKGFGFIKDESTNQEYFVHVTGLVDEIKENDWEEYITPYEEGDLEMLERVCSKQWWDKEIRKSWPNLIVFARRARKNPS